MVKIARYVGLDVHKDSIAIASCQGGPMGRAKDEGILPHDLAKLRRKLLSLAPAEHLSVVYEAGPTGYGLCRDLRAHGITCLVVAPNRVPQMPGPRIKTDKRDARHLAWQLRMGALDGIALPDEELEALRDLVRAREDALYARRRTRQQLSGLLLRHGKRWSGNRVWRGAITKSGNAHVRRVLIEAAWSGRLRPARPKRLLLRQEGLPKEVTDVAWKAQKRLYDRHRRMRARGKPQNVAIVAMARELLGFVWSVAQHAERSSA